MKRKLLVFSLGLSLAVALPVMSAQTQPNLENGWKPYGSYDISKIDTINLMNGNLTLNIPAPFHYPQRGKLEPQYLFYTTSKNWTVQCVSDPSLPTGIACVWTPGVPANCVLPFELLGRPNLQMCASPNGLALTNTFDMTVVRTVEADYPGDGTVHYDAWGYSLVTWDLAVHQLHAVPGSPTTATGQTVDFETKDATGFHVQLSDPDTKGIMSSVVVTDRAGNQYRGKFSSPVVIVTSFLGPWDGVPAFSGRDVEIEPLANGVGTGTYGTGQFATFSTVTDTNGNVFNIGSATDTLGNALPSSSSTPDFSGCVSPFPISQAMIYTYVTPNGTDRLKVCYSAFPIHTNFSSGPDVGQAGVTVTEPGLTTTTQLYLVSSITLPDHTEWTFNYDSYGEVAFVGLPTGGSISYTWTEIGLFDCGDDTPISRAVATRTVTDNNGNASVWRYNWGSQTNGSFINVVTSPQGDDTRHIFAGGCNALEMSTEYYRGSWQSGQIVKRVDTSYSSASANISDDNASGTLGNVFATDIVTTVYPSGRVTKIHRDPDTGLGTDQPIFGNVVKELDYDWGQGAPGPLLREMDTVYQWQKDSNYLAAHLLDNPASSVVISPVTAANTKSACPVNATGGTASCMAETDYFYDESNYLTNYSPAVTTQHVAPPGPVRGNQSTVSRWDSTSNAWISSHTNWYDTGEPHLKIDFLGHTTTLTYDPFYVNAYVTETCSPATSEGAVAHCVSGTYDLNTGVLTSFTNENATAQASGNTPGDSAHTSTYQYDLMFRPTQALAPPDPDPANGGAQAQTALIYSDATAPDSFPRTLTLQKSVTPTLTDSVTSTYDGVGRVYKTEHAMSSGNPARVDTVFDGTGRITSVSNPYFATTDPSYGRTDTRYDALDRSSWIKDQDGSVKQLSYDVNTSAGVAGDCMVAIDEAGNQRGTCFDALGRLVEVDEPAAAGVPVQSNYVTMQTDGNFVLYSPNNTALWATGTAGTGAGSIEIQDDGNFVLYAEKWQTNTYVASNPPGPFPVQTCRIGSALNSPQNLLTGQCITSSRGQYMLYMQPNGDLQIFNLADNPAVVTWSTATYNNPGAYASMQVDGNLVVYSSTGVPLWSSGTAGTYSQRLEMEDDGRIIIFRAAWNSGTSQGWSPGSMPHPGCDVGFGTGWTGIVWTGQCFVSPNGRYEVLMQADGNLVLYDRLISKDLVSSAAIWSTGTAATLFSSSVNLRTLYTYDALGNLTCVEQHGDVQPGTAGATGCSSDPNLDAYSPWRVRRFTYDSLSRLLTAKNPESGTISYSYDADGDVVQKTSPAPNQTGTATQTISYCYDELHRVTGKAYSAQICQGTQLPAGTAAVTYTYDSGPNAIGKLTGITDQAGSASYSYDTLGRLAGETRVINGISKTLSYQYNLDGSLNALHYPSGSAVTYTPDSAGRILSAVDSGNSINYVTGATYQADGQTTGFISGKGGAFAGVSNSFSYNKRLQPATMSASSPTQTVFSIGYDFHAGNGSGGSDNGNVWGITNYRDQSRNQTFTYDLLNRLTSAQNAGTDCTQMTVNGKTEYWGNSYSYDPWGNLVGKSVTKCSAENLTLTALWNNQLSGYGYDAAGNMTSDPTDGVSASYDAENRIATAATPQGTFAYTYDADGNRVEKVTPPAPATPATGTLYWYMTPGIVAESDLAGNLKSEYVFFNGERVARRDFDASTGAATGVFYYFSDHLKTASVITDSAGNIQAESDYYPWGGELQFVNNDSNHYKFTGKERDESGLDYFGARYYSNGLGRFITPDWAANATAAPYAEFADPQSLNLYSYVRNVPTTKYDADGHNGCCTLPSLEEVNQALQEIEAASSGGGAGISFGAILSGAAAVLVPASVFAPSVGQSNADERAAIQQASQERAQENGGVDPQVSTSGAGARKGGGKAYDNTPENDAKMAQGKPPTGKDGHPVELHSPDQTHKDQSQELTRTDHRGKGNFKQNHTNTGQQRSVVDRNQAAKDRRVHWKKVYQDKTKQE